MRQAISLDGTWKFCPAFPELEHNQSFMAPDSERRRGISSGQRGEVGWIEPGFDDQGWLDFPVPHSWNKAIPDLWSYEGIGWFRRRFEVPAEWKGKRVLFTCASSNYRTVVYVNGARAGAHDGGYTPFSVRIDPFLRPGSSTIAVSVDNVPKAERCPGGEYGWWNYGGMYRSTGLLVTDKTYIDEVVVTTEPGEPSIVAIRASIGRELGGDQHLLSACLSEPSGSESAASQAPVVYGEECGRVDLCLEVSGARLWSPEEPNLYSLRLELTDLDSGTPVDEWTDRVGIRKIEVRGPQILLNGRPLLLKGVNRHPEYPVVGHTESQDLLRRDLELIKGLGANAIRCHYPNSPATFSLCDEMGLLLVCEVPLYQWGRPEVKTESPKALEAAKDQLREMIVAYRNHPSAIIWSVSNENMTKPRRDTDEYRRLTEMTVAGNLELVDLAHELDPTRPVIEVSNCWPGDPVFARTDLSAVNIYIGAETPHVSSLHTLTDRMGERLQELRSEHPSKPILVGEFGSWAIRGLRTDYFPGEAYQAALIENYWRELVKEENFVGGFIWCFQDFDSHRRFEWDYEYRIAYGLFDLERRPKESAAVVRSMWSED